MGPTTMLFVPADRPDRFGKALGAGADAVILDLEDAVAVDKKDFARANIASCDIDPRTVFVRINAPGTRDFKLDLAMLAATKLYNVMMPKAENASDIHAVAAAIGRTVSVVPLVETAVGLDQLRGILGADLVPFVAFGSLDFALDLGCEHTDSALAYARHRLVLESRIAQKLPPIDGVTQSIDDENELATDARRARELGFSGKLVIHPAQISAVSKAFRPSQADVEWARSIVNTLGKPTAGAAQVKGQMVDRPVIIRAEQILTRANRL